MQNSLFQKMVLVNVSVLLAYSVTIGNVLAETLPSGFGVPDLRRTEPSRAQARLLLTDTSPAPASNLDRFMGSMRYLRQRNLIAKQALPAEDLAFLNVVDQDPGLALSGVRVYMERDLKSAALLHAAPGEEVPTGVRDLTRFLENKGVIQSEKVGPLLRLNSCLNLAVHGSEEWMQSPAVRTWLKEESPKFFRALQFLLRARI